MNTPITSTNFNVDATYCRFGAEIIIKLTDNFSKLIEGVIADKDIEYVHKTRVTSRRLRAALPIFQSCFAKKDYETWVPRLRQITRLLSSARDLDVQITFMEQYVKKLTSPTEQTTMRALLKDNKSSRRKVQSAVKVGLDKLKTMDTLGKIRGVCIQTIAECKESFDSPSITQEAHWHISDRLNDFLSMQQYVKIEDANRQHHQMRIYAKKLRYTMELFSSVYPNKLKKEIDTIKAFQDELGELHDYIIWNEYISKVKKKRIANKVALNQTLKNFSMYIKQKREEHYHNFIELWSACISSDFFEQIRKTTSLIVMLVAQEKTKEKLENQHVRVAVLSDIHGNLQALQKVISDADQRSVNVFLNAGDSIGYGASPNEVVELICQRNILSVVGNYDLEVLEDKNNPNGEKQLAFKYAKKTLSRGCRSLLGALPRTLRLQAADKKLIVTHGSPQSINEHIYQNTSEQRLKTLAEGVDAEVVVIGNSHEQFMRVVNGVYFINPGSVGRPGDGNPQAAYAILDFNPFRAQLIRLDYPVEAAAQALRKKGLPESFPQMLLRGRSIEDVLKFDRANEKTMGEKCKEKVAACKDFSKNLRSDAMHYLTVTNLALKLFDGLLSLHKFGGRERCWLECAAVLHDIGLSVGCGKHNKKSALIILNDTVLPFSSSERRMIAAIARYHRGGLPKQSQYIIAPLNRQTIQKICMLSGILRVADSLDYTHEGKVKLLSLGIDAESVTVECYSKTDLILQKQAFNEKKELFEKTFNRKMVLEWKQP